MSATAAPKAQYGIRSLDGVTPANSPENRQIAGRFILVFTLFAGVVGSLVGVASIVANDRYTNHPLGILIVAASIGVAGIVEAWLVQRYVPIWIIHVVSLSAIGCVVAGGFIVGSQSSYILATTTCSVVMAAVALAMTVPVTAAYVAAVGLAYAGFLVFQPHAAPLAEVWAVMGSAFVVARAVTWLVRVASARADLDRDARQQLQVVSDRQSAFLGNMSHELRTPLNAIIGFSDLLAAGNAGPLNERQCEYIDDVRSSGEHLLALIDDVLDLAKVEEGRLELHRGSVDIDALITASAALFREQAGRHAITIQVDTRGPVGRIEADERKLRQVIFNLLSNAVRFTPDHGRVEIGASRTALAATIWVRDTGPGIAPEQQDAIFEEYHQGPAYDAARQPGTGLGLALVRKFVELHGGHIELESAAGRGATFTVHLPLVAASIEPAAVAEVGPRRRFRDYFVVRSIEGATAPDAPANRTRVAQLIIGLVIPGIAVLWGTQLLFLPAPDDPRYRPLGVAIVGAVGLVAALLFSANAARIPLIAAHPIASMCTVGVTVACYFAGARHAEVVFGYIVFGIASYAVFNIGGAVAQTGFTGVCYGLLLVIQPGNFNPLGRWMIVVPGTTVASLAVLWLVGQMARLSDSERRAKAQLEIVSRHKSEFLANMSHELRTPLNAIIGFSEVLRDELFGPLTAKEAEYVDDILEAGRHLLAVINDILDLAKLEAGRMPSDARRVALAPVLEGVARRRSIDVSAEDDAAVVADEGQLMQLIDNLVTASPGAERLGVEVDNGVVRVRVEREGPPLFDDGRAFEEFHRGERVGGTGLELPLARALATLHQGRVEVADASQLEVVLPTAD